MTTTLALANRLTGASMANASESLLLSRPPLIAFGSMPPSEYARHLAANRGSPYAPSVVLFLLPPQDDPFIADMIQRLSGVCPAWLRFVFARIAQDHQIEMSIQNEEPAIIVSTGDHWLQKILPAPFDGCPPQTAAQLHGRWLSVAYATRDGRRKVAHLFPLEDLPLKRRRRLSSEGGCRGGGSSASNSPSHSPRSYPGSPVGSPTRKSGFLHSQPQPPGGNSGSSGGSPPPSPSSTKTRTYSFALHEDAPVTAAPAPVTPQYDGTPSSVPADLEELISVLSNTRPLGCAQFDRSTRL